LVVMIGLLQLVPTPDEPETADVTSTAKNFRYSARVVRRSRAFA
jgi:hypothetical protein